MAAPLLCVEGLVKRYQRGWPNAEVTFELQADFHVNEPAIVGVMGANGAGKTTLFELITGGNQPSAGRVVVAGQDIHRVRYGQRDRMALHYHQSYQLRSFQRRLPSFMLDRAGTERAVVHLFDEPQFNTQDGYIGFMLDFFRHLRAQGRLVFLCLHPNERVHLDILSEVCERFIFVQKDAQRVSRLQFADGFGELVRLPAVRDYLGALVPQEATAA
jgi:ABC-type Na+ transport system ATPase subunit NatA